MVAEGTDSREGGQLLGSERIAEIRARAEHDDWGGPAKDERSSLSVGDVTDLLAEVTRLQVERDEAQRLYREVSYVCHDQADALVKAEAECARLRGLVPEWRPTIVVALRDVASMLRLSTVERSKRGLTLAGIANVIEAAATTVEAALPPAPATNE